MTVSATPQSPRKKAAKWIGLTVLLVAIALGLPLAIDYDRDGMDNVWEFYVAKSWAKPIKIWTGLYEIKPKINVFKADAEADPDHDGLTNLQEYKLGTRPDLQDTDGDSLSDDFEIRISRLNPTVYNDPKADPDHDGINDYLEKVYELQPDVPDGDGDPDGDGLTNSEEAAFNSSPRDADIDADHLNDSMEKKLGTNPWMRDSDGVLGEYPDPGTPGDGLPDDWEIKYGFNPLVLDNPKDDGDHDGLDTMQEYRNGTDPWNPDSDGDGTSDGDEVKNNTGPNNPRWGGLVPSAPKDIKVTNNPDGSITYSWTDTSDNEDGFKIRAKQPDGTWKIVAEAPANATSVSVPGPKPAEASPAP